LPENSFFKRKLYFDLFLLGVKGISSSVKLGKSVYHFLYPPSRTKP